MIEFTDNFKFVWVVLVQKSNGNAYDTIVIYGNILNFFYVDRLEIIVLRIFFNCIFFVKSFNK